MQTIPGYSLATWVDSGEFLIGRGHRDADARPVILVTPSLERPSPQSIARLQNSYALRDSIDAAWAIRPLELVEHHGRLTHVLENPGGETLEGLLSSRPLPLGDFLTLAAGIAAALGQFHACGLTHRDIKPDYIVVDRATGRAWLGGFGLAFRLPRQRQPLDPLPVLAGTLAYMAPEQTGRMNRSVDARSDLYALGVTFYRMLTGELPFSSTDPVELVHSHLARRPLPPAERTAGVPAMVSALVLKLLAKTPEDRYQTAFGVQEDLRRCLREWASSGRIEPFPLAARDLSSRLLLPEKLYGREGDIQALRESFERACEGGPPVLVLVSGYSGIGKSSVVHELHRSLLPCRGLFASGKFDQYARDVPYATLAQAFERLGDQLLLGSDAELAAWRQVFAAALGDHGQVIVQLAPGLERVLGPQPPLPELSPLEAQVRFQGVLRRFLGALARPEHPLVLFLDDLQWVDAATIDLLKQVSNDPLLGHLLLIGAYRDNEVGFAHPLTLMRASLREAGSRARELHLGPLTPEQTGQLVADALRCGEERARPLASLVHEKAGGNPFFTLQFLATLHDAGLLRLDDAQAAWRWDLDRIAAQGFTDNVVELMLGKIARLGPATRRSLQALSCLGHTAATAILGAALGVDEGALHRDLDQAVRDGLVARSGATYTFAHDRVHEAAYASLSEAERAAMHLRLGRLLIELTPEEHRAERVFEIVDQLGRCRVLLTSRRERDELARLALLAARRARAATAYTSALSYFAIGEECLAADAWETDFSLAFSLSLGRAECELLTGHSAEAGARLEELAGRARHLPDLAAVTCLRISFYLGLIRYDRAIDIGLEYLARVGIGWSNQPTEQDVGAELQRMKACLGDRPIASLLDLPVMDDPVARGTMDVLLEVMAPAFFSNLNLYSLIAARAVALSVESGNSEGSPLAYAVLAVLTGPHLGDYASSARFGELARALVDERGLSRYRARVFVFVGHLVSTWTHGLAFSRALLQRALEAAREVGDMPYTCFSSQNLLSNRLLAGDPLPGILADGERALEFVRVSRFDTIEVSFRVIVNLIRTLRGLPGDLAPFADQAALERYLEDPRNVTSACWYWIRQLQGHVLLGDAASAVAAAARAGAMIGSSLAYAENGDYQFHAGLAHALRHDEVDEAARPAHLAALAAHRAQMAVWAACSPGSFGPFVALLTAESARIEGRDWEAVAHYEEAIRGAREQRLLQVEALACERAARLHLRRGAEVAAQAYLRGARYCHARWGADARVRQLDAEFPRLRADTAPILPGATVQATVQELDLGTVLKVYQAVSGEIVLERLVRTVMTLALEHAGAARGLLLVATDAGVVVEVEAVTTDAGVDVRRRPALADAPFAGAIVQYVTRARTRVVVDDAAAPGPFSGDPYLRQWPGRSLLVVPLITRGKLTGAIYLENDLASHAFTADRVAVLELLASQAATSLDNARLYADLARARSYMTEAERLGATGSFSWDATTGELSWSDEVFRIFGQPLSVAPSLDLALACVHPLDLGRLRAIVQRAFLAQQDFEIAFRLELAGGAIVHVDVLAHAVNAPDGRLCEYVGAVKDVTARHLAAEALAQTQSALAHVSRVATLGELTASIAHEINQPLGAVVANASAARRWLDRGPPDLVEGRAALDRIRDNAQRMKDIITRLRSLFMRGGGSREPLDLNEAIAEMIVFSHAEAVKHGVAVQTALAEGLPAVKGDRVQLQQVVLNLLGNAIQAMGEVTRERELWVRTRAVGGDVRVSVADTGPGFEGGQVERLFESFQTTKPGGMGMGLSISRSIVTDHGGRIWAETNEHGGATFHFSLPEA